MKTLSSTSIALMLFAAAACSESADPAGAKPPSSHSDATGTASAAGASATPVDDKPIDTKPMEPMSPAATTPVTNDPKAMPAASPDLVWKTGEFQLAPDQERYLCFAKTLDEDIVVGAYSNEGQKFVHHIIFARTLAPEPDGFAECDIAFRMTWNPLYITGAGASKLEFPSDAGHSLKKGTQLLAQLHLLNTSDQPVTGSVAINMYRTAAMNPRPVNTYIFGTMNVHLPPGQTSSVLGTCNVRQPIKLIAAFPHMHLLGRALHFEVGPSWDAMKEVFARDPFDFNDQRMDKLTLDLASGDKARVTCTYDNPHPMQIDYGESTRNEMCFLVGFALDRSNISACDLSQTDPAGTR